MKESEIEISMPKYHNLVARQPLTPPHHLQT